MALKFHIRSNDVLHASVTRVDTFWFNFYRATTCNAPHDIARWKPSVRLSVGLSNA